MSARFLRLVVVLGALWVPMTAFADGGKDAATELAVEAVEVVDPVRANATAIPKEPPAGADDPGNRVWLAAAALTFTAIIVLWLVRRRRTP